MFFFFLMNDREDLVSGELQCILDEYSKVFDGCFVSLKAALDSLESYFCAEGSSVDSLKVREGAFGCSGKSVLNFVRDYMGCLIDGAYEVLDLNVPRKRAMVLVGESFDNISFHAYFSDVTNLSLKEYGTGRVLLATYLDG